MEKIPFKPKFIPLIKDGIKTTTIRTLKYIYNGIYYAGNSNIKIQILGRRPIVIPRDITDDIIKTEGFNSRDEMLRFFHRYKLPQTMWLYRFNVVRG